MAEVTASYSEVWRVPDEFDHVAAFVAGLDGAEATAAGWAAYVDAKRDTLVARVLASVTPEEPPAAYAELAGALSIWFSLPVRRVLELGGRRVARLGAPTAVPDPPGWWSAIGWDEAGATFEVRVYAETRERAQQALDDAA